MWGPKLAMKMSLYRQLLQGTLTMRALGRAGDTFETRAWLGEDLLSFRGVVSTLQCSDCNITRIQSSPLGKDRGLVPRKVKTREILLRLLSKLPFSELSP